MDTWMFGLLLASFLLLQISNCEEDVIKDATFSQFWKKGHYQLNGTGGFENVDKDGGERICSGGSETELWLLTKSIKVNHTLQDVKMHVEIDLQLLNCDVKGGVCFRDGFEVFTFKGEGEPTVPDDPNDPDKKDKQRLYFKSNFLSLGYITGNLTSKKRFTHTLTTNIRKFRGITFAIKTAGGCGILYNMKIFYYVCEKKFINSVMFRRTLAPINDTIEVNGNCSHHSGKSSNMAGAHKAYCHSNGTWEAQGNVMCLCDKGFEPTTDKGCSACNRDHYKPRISNEECFMCPPYTTNNEDSTTCICKEGHFNLKRKKPNSAKPSRCYAPLRMSSRPIVKIVKDRPNTVNITWLPVKNRSSFTGEQVKYDVQCYVCQHTCEKTCEKVQYNPRQYDITGTSVLVSHLDPAKVYRFKVTPKDSLIITNDARNFTISTNYSFQTNVQEGERSEANDTNFVIIISVCSMIVILVVFFIVFVFLRKRKEKQGQFQALSRGQVALPTSAKKTYVDPSNYDRPEDAVNDFATEIDASLLFLETMIGAGEFGEVYKGSMTGSDGKKHPVAVKTLKKTATAKSERDFLLEASVMGQFDSPNVIKLIGVVTKYTPWMIVIDFMSNGSLDNFLKANDGRLSHLELISMAKGVAVGMKYLAGMNFVHRDLAARNVLIDGNLVCKVSDFGLSRELETKESSQGEYTTLGGRIPIRWTAPEATKYRKFSSASDVWSFGILLWEIMSFAERPYWEWDNFRVMEEIDNGFRLPAPLNCPKGVHDLMLQCWKLERVERPNFTEINVVLDGWIESPKTMEGDVDLSAALYEWLASIKMEDYTKNFTAAGYMRPCELQSIKEDDLRELGITLVGHRNKILKGIKVMNGKKKGGKPALKREISVEV